MKWEHELKAVKYPLFVAMLLMGFELTQAEFVEGKALDDPIREVLVSQPAILIDGQWVHPAEDLLLVERRMKASVQEYIEQTSRLETQTGARRYGRMLKNAAQERWTVRETRKAILDSGLAQSKTRANLMARTSTIWAYNEGASLSYMSQGCTIGEWFVTDDDMLCEFCLQLSGVQVPLGESYIAKGSRLEGKINPNTGKATGLNFPFDVKHAPLHPLCRCTLLPVVTLPTSVVSLPTD